MYICLDCDFVFETSKHFIEKHGLEHPPYEEFYGCPVCGGAYERAVECDICHELVPRGDIMKVSGKEVCPKCQERSD